MRVAVLVGIGLSGFCALAYEVLWARMLNLFLNNNIYSFTATIATFLLGIAAGSLLFARFLAASRAKIALFASLQIGIGLMACATPWLFSILQDPLFSRRTEALTILKTATIMIGPTVLMGIAVPLAMQICQWGAGREGRSTGVVYAFNTVGSILGAFVAGFLLIPALGLHDALLVVACLNLGAGFLPLAVRGAPGRRLVPVGAWAVVSVLIFVSAPDAMFRQIYQRATPDSEILHYKEGTVANVVVYDFKAGYKDLHLNGIEEASSRLWHVQLFKLLGVLPMMVHEDPDEALMIAFGAGMSAGAAIQHASSLEVVDLNPDIRGPAEIFRKENLDVIDSPKLTVTVNDGRNALLIDPKKYSVIISDATNPKMFDSWTLYTREFYELTRERLLPGGVFAQWLVYPLPGDSLTSVLSTFRSVYPHMSLWSIHGSSQCLMLGTTQRLNIDYQELSRRLASALDVSEFDEYGVETTEKFLSFFMLGEDELGEMLAEVDATVSTDDLPYPQFQHARVLEGIQEGLDLLKYQDTIMPYLSHLGEEEDRVRRRLEVYREISQRLNLGYFKNEWHQFQKAAYLARKYGLNDDAGVASALRYDAQRLQHHLDWLADHPDDPDVLNNLGYVYWQRGELELALERLDRALEVSPDFANALAHRAQVLMAMGDLEGALGSLHRLEMSGPTPTMQSFAARGRGVIALLRRLAGEGPSFELHHELALAYAGIGDLASALDQAEKAGKLADGDVEALRALGEFYAGLELVEEAADAFRRAAQIAPEDPELAAEARFVAVLAADADQRQSWLHKRNSVSPAMSRK